MASSYFALNLQGFIATNPVGSVDWLLGTYVLEHIDAVETMTAAAIAAACSVSRATVSRFIRSLGYDDFAAFQRDCVRWRRDVNNHLAAPADPATGSRIAGYLEQAAQAALAVRDNVAEGDIARVAQALVAAEHRVLLGSMQSGDVASILSHDLFQAGLSSAVYVSVADQVQALRTLAPHSVVVIMSVFATFFDRIDMGKVLATRPDDCLVVLCTSSCTHAIPPEVDVVLDCQAGTALAGGNHALMLLAGALALSCYQIRGGNTSGLRVS